MDKLRRALNGDDQSDEESGIISRSNTDFVVLDNNSLSYSTRIKGFVVCFIIGISLSLLGSFAFYLQGIKIFAVFYTLGSLTSIASTCFLMGPVNQIKRMFAANRYIATILVFVSIVMTLVAALYLQNPGLTLLFIILQFLAMTWYSLSFIPYARDAVKKTVESCIV